MFLISQNLCEISLSSCWQHRSTATGPLTGWLGFLFIICVRVVLVYKHCLKCQNWASHGPQAKSVPVLAPVLVHKAMFMGMKTLYSDFEKNYTPIE